MPQLDKHAAPACVHTNHLREFFFKELQRCQCQVSLVRVVPVHQHVLRVSGVCLELIHDELHQRRLTVAILTQQDDAGFGQYRLRNLKQPSLPLALSLPLSKTALLLLPLCLPIALFLFRSL
jgi:hypothetical protein